MGIKINAKAAKTAGYKYSGKEPLVPKASGVQFEPEEVGDICYVGPCDGGTRVIYYFADGGCTDGPHYTSEGCNTAP